MGRLEEIAGRFALQGRIRSVEPLGNGLINDSYIVRTDGPDDYVLQRINTAVFRDVPLLQHNIEAVTRHIRAKLLAAGDPDADRKVLRFLPLRDAACTWYADGADAWRVSVYIRGSVTREEVSPYNAEQAGAAFGLFEAQLADLPEELGETIPDFHNLELRLRQLDEAVWADPLGRAAEPAVRELLEGMDRQRGRMCEAEELHRAGQLPKRNCHCDTKVSNVLFDGQGAVLCVIDLDTVMPSFIFSDYGDFLRTAANPVAEDEADLSLVDFDLEVFRAFTRGYLSTARSFLTPLEIRMLPYAVQRFPYMQAVRFLCDYIAGDTYYKIRYPDHNLVRARNQWRLLQRAQAKRPQLEEIIGEELP